MAGSSFACNACLRRLSQAVSRTTRPETGALRLRYTTTPILRQASRPYTTTVAATVERADAPRSLDLEPLDSGVAQKKERERLGRIVKKHLDHMEDPWKIAQYVQQTLAKDRFEEALLLTQNASKNTQVVVAWNHLIDYLLEKQQVKKAIKLYNEMKKRSQLPNVQTFTIIFRGCAKSDHPKLAVAEAVKHYHILLNDSRLQPNSIHLNAVLNVCARAGDMDSMFLIADTVNESGRAATAFTYTTLLDALRHNAVKEIEDLDPEQREANIKKTLDRAKGLWTEVMESWSKARLVIDERLVCSMGRVLLLSPSREEKRQVLDLLQQTMSIPNLADAPESEAFQDSKMHNIAVSGSSKAVSKSKAVYAVPGRNTLALVLTTLASSKLTTCGIKYWNLMVRHYGVVPDNDNWLRMFGMLKVAKASAHAASILDILPDEYIGPKHYQIAMETCVRDNINPNVIKNSNTIFDSMMERLPVPDMPTLRLYLRVALVTHFQLRSKAQSGNQSEAKNQYGVQITTALGRLWDPFKKAHYHYFKATPTPSDKKKEGVLYNDKREVISLARVMYAAFNKVMNEQMLPDKDLKTLRPVSAKINREIQAFFSNREEHEPKLRSSTEASEDDASERDDIVYRPGGDFVWDTTRVSEPTVTRRDSRRRGTATKEGGWPVVHSQ